jgi:hypothetical protein
MAFKFKLALDKFKLVLEDADPPTRRRDAQRHARRREGIARASRDVSLPNREGGAGRWAAIAATPWLGKVPHALPGHTLPPIRTRDNPQAGDPVSSSPEWLPIRLRGRVREPRGAAAPVSHRPHRSPSTRWTEFGEAGWRNV